MSDTIDAEFTESKALATVSSEPLPPATLFGTDDPVEVITKASRIATALKAVVKAKGLIANIKGKEYPVVEAWQTMAAMMSISAVCEWSRPISGGWEARVVLYNSQGKIIGSADAQCTKDEAGKKSWEDYALRSMSQTRATSKAYRSNLGFIMTLAGYQATPAEEMPVKQTPQDQKNVAVPSIQSLMMRAKEKGLCTNGSTFCAWAAENVFGCEGLALGVKPTPDQCLAISEAL